MNEPATVRHGTRQETLRADRIPARATVARVLGRRPVMVRPRERGTVWIPCLGQWLANPEGLPDLHPIRRTAPPARFKPYWATDTQGRVGGLRGCLLLGCGRYPGERFLAGVRISAARPAQRREQAQQAAQPLDLYMLSADADSADCLTENLGPEAAAGTGVIDLAGSSLGFSHSANPNVGEKT